MWNRKYSALKWCIFHEDLSILDSPGAIPASMIPTPIPIPADFFDSDSDSDSDSSHLGYDSDSDSDSNTICMNDSDSIQTRFRLQRCLYSYSDFRII